MAELFGLRAWFISESPACAVESDLIHSSAMLVLVIANSGRLLLSEEGERSVEYFRDLWTFCLLRSLLHDLSFLRGLATTVLQGWLGLGRNPAECVFEPSHQYVRALRNVWNIWPEHSCAYMHAVTNNAVGSHARRGKCVQVVCEGLGVGKQGSVHYKTI